MHSGSAGEVTIVIAAMLLIVTVRCIANKIAAMALLMYIKEHIDVPDKEEIMLYTSRAAKKFFICRVDF